MSLRSLFINVMDPFLNKTINLFEKKILLIQTIEKRCIFVLHGHQCIRIYIVQTMSHTELLILESAIKKSMLFGQVLIDRRLITSILEEKPQDRKKEPGTMFDLVDERILHLSDRFCLQYQIGKTLHIINTAQWPFFSAVTFSLPPISHYSTITALWEREGARITIRGEKESDWLSTSPPPLL